jgi:hypothetical protein
VEVIVDPNVASGLCGLCGDCDNDVENDWTVGPNRTCVDEYPAGSFPSIGSPVCLNATSIYIAIA